MCMVMDWLNANAGVISCISAIATAFAAERTWRIAKKADERERKICYAAVVDIREEYVDSQHSKLTIFNNGNVSANKVRLFADGVEFENNVSKLVIGLLPPKKEYSIILENFSAQYSITIEWDDEYKKGNRKTEVFKMIGDD